MRPMLAPREDPMSFDKYWDLLPFPLYVSPKLDGIRCLTYNGKCYSRTMKELPSRQVQELFSDFQFFDGEIIVGDPTSHDVYNKTQSHVMSRDKAAADVSFFVFDSINPLMLENPFFERLDFIEHLVADINVADVYLVPQILVHTKEELEVYEKSIIEKGYEGVMLRTPEGIYKQKRCTFRDKILYKLKRFKDDEGIILDILEGENNLNEMFSNELGLTSRTSHKDNRVKSGIAGAMIVEWLDEDNEPHEIRVAPGMLTHVQRRDMLLNPERYIGEMIKYRYMTYGMKDLPRFPRFVGFRSDMDI